MDFHVLGPLDAYAGGVRVDLGRRQERRLLGLLLLETGHAIPIDRLVNLLWEEAPPTDARAALHTHVARLRARLSPHGLRLESRSGSYRLDTPRESVDANRFADQVALAIAIQAPAERAAKLGEALALWRGELLADVLAEPLRERLGVRLESLRMQAIEQKAAADLATGRHGQVVTDLTELAERHPTSETLVGLLMTALYRCGRQAEALAVYRATRRHLVEVLGIEAGAELQRLHEQILRNDPSLAAVQDLSTVDADAVPQLLPLDVRGFAGRRAEQGLLDLILADLTAQPGRANVVVISGMGGVGKTALAVHWAHRVRDRFPDGQLYVNLRGFDPTGTVITAAAAIRRFLDALAVPDDRIPADPDSQVNLFRTLLADKRMLIVLDNARDCDQVRPLLPGAAGCLVVVTSRDTLTGLVAAEGAQPLSLEPLSHDEAHDLLSLRLGGAVAAAAPETVEDIIACCARLPLALVIVAAQALTDPHRSLTAIVGRLRGDDRLDALSTHDTPATDLRAVLSWSYQALGGAAARLFTLLGLHPGPDISVAAAASLAALPAEQTRSLLSELVRAHLVDEHTPGRYTFHDLLRAYAADLARSTLSGSRQRAATGRILGHYLHTAYAADRLLEPAREPITLAPAEAGVNPENFVDREQALAWFTAEHTVLRAAVEHAATHDLPAYCWQLAWSLFVFFDRHGHWYDLIAVHHTAAAATKQLADEAVQLLIHRSLARACIQLGRFHDANTHLRDALTTAQTTNDTLSQANIHNSLGHLSERAGRHEAALHHALLAVDLFRTLGHRHGEANTLNGVGWCYAMLGNQQQALAHCYQSLHLLQELDDRFGQAHAWDSLGYIHFQAGEHSQALTCYEHALALARECGASRNAAEHLAHLGDVHHATGNIPEARHAWQQALTVLEQIDHPEADEVREKLTKLG